MPWYKEWFGEEYLELYSHRDDSEAEADVDLVERLLGGGPQPRAVLDLACGAGRHTAALRRRGYRTLGVDLSLTLLARMRARGLPRVAGDMRRLPFSVESFDWVLSFFSSFGYFETERENFRVLEEVVRILVPGGWFLMDLMNPGPALAGLQPRDSQALDNDRHGRRAEIERRYDPDSRRIEKSIVVSGPGGPPRTFHESVRLYQPEEVIMGLRWAGFEIVSLHGNFQGDPYERDSERLILLCTKPA